MNLGQIRSRVYYRMGIQAGDSVDDEYTNLTINEDYAELVSELGFNIQSSDLVFVADDPIVDLPADTYRVLTITQGDFRSPLLRFTPEELAENTAYRQTLEPEPTNNTGPINYAERDVLQIEVDPPPKDTTATGGICRYVAQVATLVNDTDIPVHLPVAYHKILTERSVASTALAEEELGLMQAAEARETRLWQKINRDKARRPGGHRFARPRALPPARVETH